MASVGIGGAGGATGGATGVTMFTTTVTIADDAPAVTVKEAWYWPSPNPDVRNVSVSGLVLTPEVGDTDSQLGNPPDTDHFNAPLPELMTWIVADGALLPTLP
jgi:hypothetical protein